MTFVDTNVLIDIFDNDGRWHRWSSDRMIGIAASAGRVMVNLIVVGELAPGYATADLLLDKLQQLSAEIVPLDLETSFVAGRRFGRYRQQRAPDVPGRLLADFMIGAHALTLGAPLLTRDARLYRRYFPELTLITPETEHG